MNVLILGCSFGVPGQGCPEELHTENQLKSLGYNVVNCAGKGFSNLESLNLAKKFLQENTYKVDWIVWFHTELTRDQGITKSDLLQTAKNVYNKYKNFIEHTNAKTAIIGGAAPVLPLMFDFINPDFCIPSWFNKILNLDLPQIQTLSRLDMVEKMQSIGIAQKFKILQQHEEILNALLQSEDFGDNYHAGPRPHMELAQELHLIFSKY